MNKKVFIRTFGCQMNVRDSEFIVGVFLEKGYKLAASPDEADIILFNTCTVRNHAEERAIHSMAHLMNRCKGKLYGMVGCAAQSLKSELFKKLPQLNLVCGTGEIAALPELVKKARLKKVLAVDRLDEALPELNPPYRQDKKHTYVSIMRGCNNFCSYCIVPYVRGSERSRRAEDIVDEIEGLVRQGIEDIILLGQNVNSYRSEVRGQKSEVRGEVDFVNLLEKINRIEGIKSIYFLTSHPKDASIELFEAMRDLDKIKKHLHLPLQSGSGKLLELMNRGYTPRDYAHLVFQARDIVPNLRLTTDIIVGFPGETEEDFSRTLELVRQIEFDLAYIFKYSSRPGTKAAELPDNVPEGTKKERHAQLLELQRQISRGKQNVK